jgi:hypothetical protein
VIHAVPAELVNNLWPAIDIHTTAALDFHPFLTSDDLRTLLLNGHAQLFVAVGEGRKVQGFAAMEVVRYPARLVANILASGGDEGFLSTAIHELLPILKQWAAEHGADAIALTGRPGWIKALRDEGGNAEKLVMWWSELGDVQGRRQLEKPTADGSLTAVGQGAAVPL